MTRYGNGAKGRVTHLGRGSGASTANAAPTGSERDLVRECQIMAAALNVYVEVVGQRKAKGSGTTVGVADMLVYCAGQVLPVELKRAKHHDGTPAGTLSIGQIVAMERRQEAGVRTAVVTTVEEFVAVVNGMRKARGVLRRTTG